MKSAIFFLFLSLELWAKPVVLVSYYDAFGGAPFNNSERVARALEQKINGSNNSIQIKLCGLKTVFDKSYAQIEECLRSLTETPVMVVGLGEAGCEMKIEMVAKNLDKTRGPDNEGQERKSTPIIPEGELYLGLRFPVLQMYCSVEETLREDIGISNDAGSFVCNNTLYQLSYHYPEIPSGFIHLPANNCRQLEKKNEIVLKNLEKMITQGANYLNSPLLHSMELPHSSNEFRLPIKKEQWEKFREKSLETNDKCQQDFFKRARGVDERWFWSMLSSK